MTDLVVKAEQVAQNAYAPYSEYLVGAVVRTRDGQEFAGTNVENAAYPLGVCAEKTAISAAATAGYRPGGIEAHLGADALHVHRRRLAVSFVFREAWQPE